MFTFASSLNKISLSIWFSCISSFHGIYIYIYTSRPAAIRCCLLKAPPVAGWPPVVIGWPPSPSLAVPLIVGWPLMMLVKIAVGFSSSLPRVHNSLKLLLNAVSPAAFGNGLAVLTGPSCCWLAPCHHWMALLPLLAIPLIVGRPLVILVRIAIGFSSSLPRVHNSLKLLMNAVSPAAFEWLCLRPNLRPGLRCCLLKDPLNSCRVGRACGRA